MLVRPLEDRDCYRCGAAVGVGLKEEPTGWKVYRVCTGADSSCPTERVGTIDRSDISTLDEVAQKAENLL